ncbi:MAG: SDR family oxidoreductase [Thermoleophilia bacterium]|nr:SDR family oxidoreductase [Thermoleophilia bacterium]
MSSLRGIEGRLVLISGAGQGIGRATAERLASEGARVLVNDINPDTAQAVAAQVGGHAVPFDVSDTAAVDAALTGIEVEHGVVTLLVANHAYMTMAPFVDHSEFDFERHLTVNLIGTALLMQRCLPGMIESGYGRIVAMTSEWGVIGWPNATAYAASKGGIIALTKSVARAHAAHGIAANLVAPGTTDTPQLDVDAIDAGLTHEEMVAVYAAESPLGRINRPADMAATIAFLLSEPAVALVGQIISPNGGTTRL